MPLLALVDRWRVGILVEGLGRKRRWWRRDPFERRIRQRRRVVCEARPEIGVRGRISIGGVATDSDDSLGRVAVLSASVCGASLFG